MSQFVARGAVPNKNQKALNDSCSGVPAETRGPATVEEISADDCLISVNDNYIIVSKPPDVRMDGDFDVTLQKMLLHWIPGSSVASLKWVHQLDYATSGILCVARTKKAAGLAGISFQTRETSKEYLAIIEGHIDPKKWPERESHHTISEEDIVAKSDPNKKGRAISAAQCSLMRESLQKNYAVIQLFASTRESGAALLGAHTEADVSLVQQLLRIPYDSYLVNSRYRKALKTAIRKCEALSLLAQEISSGDDGTDAHATSDAVVEPSKQSPESEELGAAAHGEDATGASESEPVDPAIHERGSVSVSGGGSVSGSIYRTTRSGDDDEACLIIDIPVAEVPGQFRCQVGNTHNPGLRSRTRLRVLQHGYYQDQPVSKVVLEPHTGRRHQLRVHCWALGHPIVGDFTYGPPRAAQAERMMLHASRLRIAVPERERRYLTQRWNELGLTEESESIVSAQAPDLLVHLDGVHP